MATVVLSPQDCLPSTHKHQKSFLSSARSENSIFKAVMVPSPMSQDCARRTNGGGSPSGDGILPVPLVHRKVRVPAKKACPPKVPSTSTSTSISSLKSKLLSSSSAILPTPSVGSPPLAEGLLKERLSSKVVQGNEPGNNIDHYQGSAVKKVLNQRHRVGKKPIVAQNHVSCMTINGKFERSNSGSKILHEDEAVSGVHSKEMMVRMHSKSERNSSQRAACEKEDAKTDFPVVTILQRPKSDEAAVKLLAKFFQNGMEQDLRDTNEGIDMMLESSGGLYAMVEEKERDGKLAIDESSVPDSFNVCPHKGVLVESAAPFVKSGAELKNSGVEDTALVDAVNFAATLERVHSDGDPLCSSKGSIWETSCEELATWERWAGPCYINSPPPSALPLPRFSKKLMKIVAVGSGCAEQCENAWSEQLSSPPASLSPLFVSLARQQHLNINADAVATATRDLKRMLNLDLCRV